MSPRSTTPGQTLAFVTLFSLALGAVAAGVVAYATIRAFIALLGRMGLAPFALYRLFLGAVLFWIYF